MQEKALFERYDFTPLPYRPDVYERDGGRRLYRIKKYGEMWMLTIFSRHRSFLSQVGPRHVFYQAEHAADFVQRNIEQSKKPEHTEYLGT